MALNPENRLAPSGGAAAATPPVARRTVLVLLDYCGGRRTDRLFARLKRWNPGARLALLDNGSPLRPPRLATHRNAVNSFVGGGICDAVKIAEVAGASYLFFCVNDIRFENRLAIADFEAIMDADDDVVMVSCALTRDSLQSAHFPWMRRRPGGGVRQVRQADLLCCQIRLDHLRGFGGLPVSRGGWGYSEEIAFHARLRGKKIYVDDRCAVRHVRASHHTTVADGLHLDKMDEARAVYGSRYASLDALRAIAFRPLCDEERNVLPGREMRASLVARGARALRLVAFGIGPAIRRAARRLSGSIRRRLSEGRAMRAESGRDGEAGVEGEPYEV